MGFSCLGRVFLGIMLSLTVLSLAFKTGRELVKDLLFNSIKNTNIIT